MLKRRRFTVPGLVSAKSIASTRRRKGGTRVGYTLLELMVVCTIAAVLIALSGKGLSAAFAGNARISADRVVSSTLFQARAIAIQRSRQSWLVRSGNTIRILADSLGTRVQLGQTVDLSQRYGVTLGSNVTVPSGRDSVSFDPRGLITGTTTAYSIIVSKGTSADTLCVSGLGNTRARGC